ncbi:MAG: fibronectin type III domain-containing protein, partial [Bacteroidales bacterium]|nr:fibronectin type III domain-containing protein [Bacteroidales bacterium]
MRKHHFFVAVMALMMPLTALAQQLGAYSISVSQETYTSIASASRLLSSVNGDGGNQTVTLPFSFTFGETTFPQGTPLTVRADGYIYFGSTGPGHYVYNAWTTSHKVICPLMAGDGKITASGATSGAYSLATIDGNGDSMLVIEWKGLQTYSANYGNYNVQLRLHTDGRISAVYGNSTVSSATVKHTFLMTNDLDDRVCLTGTWQQPVVGTPAALGDLGTTLPEEGTVITWSRPESYCPRPSGLTVSNITSDGASFSWTAAENNTDYILTVGQDEYTVTGTTQTVTGLQPATAYTAALRTLCSSGDTSNAVSISFYTECVSISLNDSNYNEGFENWSTAVSDFSPCWNRLQANLEDVSFSATASTYRPVISTTQAHTGTKALRMVSYYYYDYDYGEEEDYGSLSFMPIFENDLRSLKCTFWYKVPSNYSSVRLAVGVSSTTADTSTFTRLMTIAPTDNEWHQYEVDLMGYTGTGNRITFFQYSWDDSYNSLYGYIDDIHVENLGDCFKPAVASVSSLEAESAVIEWVELNTVGAYKVVLNDDEANAIIVNGDTMTTVTLEANTDYTAAVSTLCNGEYTDARTVSFHTPCLPVSASELPWSESFDSLSQVGYSLTPIVLPCMDVHNYLSTYSSYPYAYSSTHHGDAGNSLYFYSIASQRPVVVLPLFESALNTLQVSFFLYGSSTNYGIEVGVMTNATDRNTFQPLDTFYLTTASTWNYVEVNLSDYTFSGSRIALRPVSDYLYLDDLSVSSIPSCVRPTGITIANVGQNSASLIVNDPTYNNDYTVTINGETVNANDTIIDLTDLTANTTYNVSLVSNCSDGSSTFPLTASFRTACGVTTLPYVEDFENQTSDQAPSCWNHLNPVSASDNYLRVYGNTAHNGSRCLRFNYSEASGNIIAMPEFDSEIAGLEMSFWHRPESASNSSCGTFEVGYLTDAEDASSFVVVNSWVYNEMTTNYQQDEVTFAGAPAGARIAFRHKGSTNNWYWHVDDINVHVAPSCIRPVVQVASVTSDEAVLNINDANEANNYSVLVYRGTTLIDSLTVTENSYTLGSLTSSTPYTVTVRTICDDQSLTAAVSVSFRTACGSIDTLPWTEGFENYSAGTYGSNTSGFHPDCWTVLNRYSNSSSYPYVNSSASNVHGGSKCLSLYGNANPATIVALPPFSDPLSGLMLSFWMRRPYSNMAVEVGYMTNPSDASSFVMVQSCSPAASDTYEEFEVFFPAEATGQIALRYSCQSSGYNLFIDDITVRQAPSCTRPTSIVVSDVISDGATVTLSDVNDVNHYWLRYGEHDSVEVNGTTYIFSGLTPGTNYTLSARTICSDGSLTASVSTTFATLCAPYTIPYSTSFESNANGTVPMCWTNLAGRTTISNFSSGVHTGSQYLDFRGAVGNMIAMPSFTEEINTLQVRFWTRPENFTNSSCGTLHVGYLTNLTDTSSFISVTSYPYNSFSEMTEKEVSMAGAPEGAYIAFRQTDNATNYYWYIDDVVVEPIASCPRPASVSMSDIAATQAAILVNDPSQTGSYYYAVYKDTVRVDSAAFNGDSVVVTGLTPGTGYTVSVGAVCGSEFTAPVSTSFYTACANIVDMPWNEGFESWRIGSANANPCWGRIYGGYSNTTSNYPYATSSQTHSGSNALYFYSYYDNDGYNDYSRYSVSFLPVFDYPVNNLTMRFWYKVTTSYDFDYTELSVGVASSDADTTTFTRLMTIAPVDANWHEYDIDFSTYTGTGNRIVIMQRNIDGDYEYYDDESYYTSDTYGYIDDIVIDTLGSCSRPATLTVSNIDTTTATLTWTDINGAGDYSVRWTANDSVRVNGALTYQLTGLQPSMVYDVTVRRYCDGVLTDARSASFKTAIVPVSSLPYSCDFENQSEVNSWDFVNGTPNKWYIGTAANNGGTQGLYISNNEGTSNTYTKSSTSASFAVRSFDFAAGSYVFSFDWKNNGENNYDFIRVWLAPDSVVLTPNVFPVASRLYSNTPTGWTDIVGGQLQGVTTWQTETDTVAVATAGRYKLIFAWRNDGSGGLDAPAAIDNISVSMADSTVTPPAPTTYTVSAASTDATMGSATVSPSGIVNEGTQVTFTATANSGYHFVAWTSGTTQVSTANPYTTTVTSNLALTATFEADGQNPPQPTTYTVTLLTASSTMGSVSP